MDDKVGRFVDNLPSYSEKEVAEHNKLSKRVWVTCKLGVYDVTDYVDQHPGGEDNIMRGAGRSIEPFWEEYPIHYSEDTFDVLESMRIGNLVTEPSVGEPAPKPSADPWANEPKRNPRMKVVLERPFNAETPKDVIANNLITPNDLHYVQNHLPVPHVDVSTYRLEIFDEISGKKCFLTMTDLTSGKFPIYTFPVTIQCGGNKRKLMNEIAPVYGIMWDVSAIGTAEWTGVKLRDVLDSCQFDGYLTNDKIEHIHFEGLDIDSNGVPFGISIPKEKLLRDGNDLMLAFKMNGADLPPDHGYPLRFVMPGCIGNRNIKWLGRIVLSSEECKCPWFKNDYKVLPPFVKSLKDVDFSAYKPIYESPVQSGICQPVDGEKIDKTGKLMIKGFAFSGGGNSIEKVLVSMDDGQNWKLATLKNMPQKARRYRNWTWTLWECEMEVPEAKQSAEIVCVATDSQQNSQPESTKAIWNAKGVVNNSWHRIKVEFK